MKPIKLVMSAFGPYADKVTVDFTKYEEKGLFLITGKTGSGKTTIFDGISYALYGRASGEYRGTGHLRSDYADPSVKTFVEFTFEHQGHNYVIRREPEYERRKLKGEGTTRSKENAILIRDGEVPAEGLKTINRMIVDLINVDFDQFKQIAMIAQSEFYSLLNASTDDRTRILRSIFSTEGYNQIALILKKYSSESRAAKENARRSIIQYFNDVRIDDESEDEAYTVLRDKCRILQSEVSEGSDIRDTDAILEAVRGLAESEKDTAEVFGREAGKKDDEATETARKLATAVENNKKLDQKEKSRQAYAELAARESEMLSRKKLYEQRKLASHEIKPVYDKYMLQVKRSKSAEKAVEESETLLERLKSEAEKCGAEESRAREDEPKAAEYESYANQIKRDKEDYHALAALGSGITALKKRKEQCLSDLDKCRQQMELLDAEIKNNENIVKELKDIPPRLKETESEIDGKRELRRRVQLLVTKRMGEYRREADKLKKLRQVYTNDSNAYERARNESENAEKLFEFSQAGLLAAALEEGTPCPVCGAVHHPHKASLPEHSVTEDEVKEARKRTEKARNAREVSFAGVKEANANVTARAEALAGELAEVLTGALPENASESMEGRPLDELVPMAEDEELRLSDEIAKGDAEIAALQKSSEKLQAAEVKVNEDRKKKEDADAKHRGLMQALQEITAELSGMQGQLESLKKLPYKSWSEANAEMTSLTSKAKGIRDRINSAEHKKKMADEAVAGSESALESRRGNFMAEKETEESDLSQLEAILAKYGYGNKEAAAALFTSEDELSRENSSLQKYDREKEVAKAEAGRAAKEAEGRKRIDTDTLQREYSRLRGEAQLLHAKQNAAADRAGNNTDIAGHIAERRHEYEEARSRYHTADNLYKLVSGQTGSGKITFEQYVQAAKFDGIIRAANRRLREMSGGQYELFRQNESIGKKTNTFLDLEVLDHYTGRRRPVNTLSGGESFDASLSLALGLSDTISSNLGGIQIDALFVDEGFGTLDSDSIGRVLETLTGLSEHNKLVGVISHREELAEAIPQKIIVEKGAGGSYIREENGE